MNKIEQTLSIIKPDAVERNLIDKIKIIFTNNNLKIKEDKKIHLTKEEASEFYKVHQSKPFYDQLCNYLSSGPIFVMIFYLKNFLVAEIYKTYLSQKERTFSQSYKAISKQSKSFKKLRLIASRLTLTVFIQNLSKY